MYVILAVSVVALASLFIMRTADGAWGGKAGNFAAFSGLDILLWWSYILLVVGILTTVVMTIVNMGKNPGGSKQSLYGLIVLVVVLVVAYLMSSTEPVAIAGGKTLYTDKGGLRLTDMGIYTAYFALIAAVGAVIWGGVKNTLK